MIGEYVFTGIHPRSSSVYSDDNRKEFPGIIVELKYYTTQGVNKNWNGLSRVGADERQS
jgi:hypothetical protein